jgi:hypothetical protein
MAHAQLFAYSRRHRRDLRPPPPTPNTMHDPSTSHDAQHTRPPPRAFLRQGTADPMPTRPGPTSVLARSEPRPCQYRVRRRSAPERPAPWATWVHAQIRRVVSGGAAADLGCPQAQRWGGAFLPLAQPCRRRPELGGGPRALAEAGAGIRCGAGGETVGGETSRRRDSRRRPSRPGRQGPAAGRQPTLAPTYMPVA